ncbi:uncharacterized protein K02A2.6-like [Corticium candelabrum]|uniref:uncharacterized protein K02A2.6-like n=1 Tax=Corticium candelabrum TaxID=121492 RepID=UPI002E274F2A|nr:uncharacterized protein K02A2.6-like [Corticium candelabrum]
MVQANPPDVISEFRALFQSDMGTLRGYQANITLQKGAIPRFQRQRSVPYALQEKVEEELGRLQNEGILKLVDYSDWAAPVVVVRRRDGSLRICGDYKVTVNSYLEMNAYPLPNPQDLFATLARGGGRYFSELEMKQAYLQMKVSPQSQKYLTINKSKGLFAYTRMPFESVSRQLYGNVLWTESYPEFPELAVFRRHFDRWENSSRAR